MLPAAHRIRCSADFDRVVRGGARIGRKNLVLHLRSEQHDGYSRVGFVVSKAVGPAVTRNLVKRRLRAIIAQELPLLPRGTDIVVRALPAAGRSDFAALKRDIQSGLAKYTAKMTVKESVI